MGKYSNENPRERQIDTKLLYKISNNTIFTHSRTCSGVSQLYSRSAVLQIKKNLQETSHYYNAGGKIRRDLSLETDICVLRRYYKNKRYKASTYDSSAKSRYSTFIDTEVETIEEFPDTSACGDNDQTDLRSNPTLDIATLMIDNLKDLLSKWFQRHLIDNKSNREKIDTVIDVLLSQLEHKVEDSSSYSTYFVHREANNRRVKSKKIDTSSFTRSCRKRKSFMSESSDAVVYDESSFIPLIPYNDMKMISTLSIPRSFHKKMYPKKSRLGSSLCKLKNRRHNDLFLSLDRSNKFLDSSSLDLLDFSKSGTKHLKYINPKYKKTRIILQPDYKTGTNHTSSTAPEDLEIKTLNMDNNNINYMPSLLKSLYVDDPANVTSTERHCIYEIYRQETFTMTDNSTSLVSKHSAVTNASDKYSREERINKKISSVPAQKPTLTVGFISNSVEFPNIGKPDFNKTAHLHKNSCKLKNKIKRINKWRNRRLKHKFQDMQNKQFTLLYKKAMKHSQGKDFLKHCRSIFEYFVNYKGNRNIKLDIKINVLPLMDETKKDASTITNKPKLSLSGISNSFSILYNVDPDIVPILANPNIEPTSSSENNADFISLLDAAVSQSKYIFNTMNYPNELSTINVDRSTITSELQIVQEISELRSIIKDLILAAEKLVNENMKRELKTDISAHPELIKSQSIKNFSTSSKWGADMDLTNLSKAVQCSSNQTKTELLSGFKISKGPKKRDTSEIANRLAKKSTSYRIIDSESIVKVTDMTSNNNDLDREKTEEGLTFSIPKSRSLFEMTTKRNKRKLMAFFCNDATTTNYETCYQTNTCTNKWKVLTKKQVVQDDSSTPLYRCSQSCMVPPLEEENGEDCTSTYSRCCSDPEANKYVERPKGMNFVEGCFYCLLLWIPVIIIMSLFYAYILKDMVQPKPVKKSTILFKLSDFGF